MTTSSSAAQRRRRRYIRLVPLAGAALVGPTFGETVLVQPSVDVLESYVHQTNVPSTTSFGGQTREWVTQVTPGLKVNARGNNSLVQGEVKADAYYYSKGTRPDQVIPTGQLLGRTESRDTGVGIEGAWTARQEPDLFASNSDSGLIQRGYATTEWRVSPFFERKLSAETTAKARVDQTWVHSNRIGSTTPDRPDTQVTAGQASLARRPVPFGYELGVNHQTTHVTGQSDPVLTQSIGRAKGLYALTPDLEVGALIGHESDKVLLDSYNDRVHGWLVRWTPEERTLLDAQVEHRFFGQAWQVNASHRMPWLALSGTFNRTATTYGSSLGTVAQGSTVRDLFDAMLTTYIPDPAERAKAVDDIITTKKLSTSINGIRDIYNLNAQLRKEASGRMVIMGRRNTLSLSAGRVDAEPLTASVALLTSATTSRQYFFYSELNHQLTPTSRLIANLRWNRLHNSPVGQPYEFARSFSWSTAYSTDLAPRTSATVGLRRQISHSTKTGESDESAAFAGLGYRF
ncbi:MAG TPA: TIGR03016 family PEP-CTERM system-associated outer membrane protein [Aquabacterium sp.]|nr:TIGR03016 family PEP-CTERM system-associated outer membrane protein [Aquabacterium sp.]